MDIEAQRLVAGIGTMLIDSVEAELASCGISDPIVAVMVGNSDAQRLYERRGSQPAEIMLYRFGGNTSQQR